MLNRDEIEANKERFMGLINKLPELTDINRLYRFDSLIKLFENSDWFVAPASTKFHHSYEGGLCQHSLEVYDNLKMLNEQKCLGITEDSLIICGLLHDLAKVNYYELSTRNTKVDGQWVQVPYYKTTDNPVPYGTHEEACAWMVRQYIGLTFDEEVAILHHHMGMGFDSSKSVPGHVFTNRFAVSLHLADMTSAFLDSEKDKSLC